MRGTEPPPGYARFEERGTIIVARDDVAPAVREAYRQAPSENPTLHGYASRVAGARSMEGRAIAYAVTLPETTQPVVVRHNRHGGALRALTGDLFAGRTRAPLELEIAIAIAAIGVPTPAVVGYAIYPAAFGLARSDVVTEEVTASDDLGNVLLRSLSDSPERQRAWSATQTLLQQLATAGVRHRDLNVKNILIRMTGDSTAYLLDVDRVELGYDRDDADTGNRARLLRSMEKWQRTRGAKISMDEIAFLRSG
jgi:tRNA A-37 threonylcarbamoyl transferase component Bud32